LDSELECAMRSFMYRHPCRAKNYRYRAIALLAACAMVLVLPPMFATQLTQAAAGPLVVDGHVYDQTMTAVSGATVVVAVTNGATLRGTQTTTTDSVGFYTVTIDPNQWDVGNTLTVVATKLPDVGEASKTIDSDFQTVDVMFGAVIPEFGPGMMAGVAGLTALIVIVGVRRRRKGQDTV